MEGFSSDGSTVTSRIKFLICGYSSAPGSPLAVPAEIILISVFLASNLSPATRLGQYVAPPALREVRVKFCKVMGNQKSYVAQDQHCLRRAYCLL